MARAPFLPHGPSRQIPEWPVADAGPTFRELTCERCGKSILITEEDLEAIAGQCRSCFHCHKVHCVPPHPAYAT